MIHRWEFTGIREREELKYCLINAESKEVIGTEEAERVTNRALIEGEDLMSANLVPIETLILNSPNSFVAVPISPAVIFTPLIGSLVD